VLTQSFVLDHLYSNWTRTKSGSRKSVIVDGKALPSQPSDAITQEWSYDGNTLSTIVHISLAFRLRKPSISSFVVQQAQWLRAQLDGFAGAIVCLHSAYDILNQQWSFIWSPDPLTDAWQTGDRRSYRPETACDELSHFAQWYNSAQASVQQLLEPIENLPDGQLSRQLSKRGNNVAIEQAQLYKTALKRALAQSSDL
jgi:hypothetical protein